jgi:hypothetical protein
MMLKNALSCAARKLSAFSLPVRADRKLRFWDLAHNMTFFDTTRIPDNYGRKEGNLLDFSV